MNSNVERELELWLLAFLLALCVISVLALIIILFCCLYMSFEDKSIVVFSIIILISVTIIIKMFWHDNKERN